MDSDVSSTGFSGAHAPRECIEDCNHSSSAVMGLQGSNFIKL